MRIGHHRRFTANHTWHLDWLGQALFIKLNPNAAEAAAEVAGHERIRDFYPVPRLRWHKSIGSFAILAYERHDSRLLLDEINIADRTGNLVQLDAVLDRVLDHYSRTITATVLLARQADTVTKLYADRVRPGGRLDTYYGANRPLLTLPDGESLRPSELRSTPLVVNGRPHHINFAHTVANLRRHFRDDRAVWAATTQGDPTDVNIGTAPVWFDYDTGGLNALPGEFAGFLWYQRLLGGWLVPTYNAAAFRDHPATLAAVRHNQPTCRIAADPVGTVHITYQHDPSPARQHVITRYYRELVLPVAEGLGIADTVNWLRPYLALRILGVYDIGRLATADAALSLAYLAETLSPHTSLSALLGVPDLPTRGVASWPDLSRQSPEPAPASVPPSRSASHQTTT